MDTQTVIHLELRAKTRLGMGILEFFECPWLLNNDTLSPIQRIMLKTVMGEPLEPEGKIERGHEYQDKEFENEIEMYKYFTGKTVYKPSFYSDVDWCIGRRSGKTQCVNSHIQLADGSMQIVGELVGQEVDIIAWDKVNGEYLKTKANVVHNGVKPCSKIITKYGQELDRTDNHPLFTVEGWASVDGSFSPDIGKMKELKVGDRIAVPINNPIEGEGVEDENLVKLLGYFLADGSFKHGCKYTLYNETQKEEILSILDGDYKIYDKRGTTAQDLSLKSNNSIYKLIDKLGLKDKGSKDKFIPNWIYKLNNKQISLFLNRLISTDGWICISKGDNPEVGFSSSSEKLSLGVKRLLARLGIVSNLHKAKAGYKKDGQYIDCLPRFSVMIENNSEILKFIERVGVFGKDDKLEKVLSILKSNNSFNTQLDTMPYEFCNKFALKLRQKLSYTKQEKINGRIRPDRCASKERLLYYANMYPEFFKEELEFLNMDFYWDEITEIQDLGEIETAGLEVPIYHTYINDVLEHNSTMLGAGLATYFATQFDYTPYLRTSPHATIPIISPTKKQAGEVYEAIKSIFLHSPYLFETFLDGTIDHYQEEFSEDQARDGTLIGGTIKLNNRVRIEVMAADVSKIRGMAVPFAILDECCFFGTDSSDNKNTDKGIYEALAPALLQFQSVPGMAMILKISSPNGQSGLMYENFLQSKDTDVIHFQVPTWYANPTVPVSYLEKQKKKGMSYFNREYGAEYTASEASYLDPDLIDKTVIKGVEALEPQDGFRYVAAMDYATKDDYWTLAIGHKEYVMEDTPEGRQKKERVFIDFMCHWRGSSGGELDPSEIIPEIAAYMKKYKVHYLISDQYAYAPLRSLFQREGCILKEYKVTHQSKLKYMYSMQVAINSGTLRIVSNPLALRHLKDLREKRSTQTNKIRIEHAANCHDDYADVIGLVIYQFDSSSPLYVGTHYEDDHAVINTKDKRGNHLAYPTAQELAEHHGLSNFHDNRIEVEERLKDEKGEKDPEDPDDGNGFWFVF